MNQVLETMYPEPPSASMTIDPSRGPAESG